MKISRIVMLAGLAIMAATALSWGRNLLDRKVYYQNASTGKIAEAKYWVVYFGNHDVTLNRKFPGEDSQMVNGSMNLSLLSSGYIEGNGFSSKGRLDCLPLMKIRSDKGIRSIPIDSITCIFEYGEKVLLTNGELGDFVIDLEGQALTAKKFTLSEFKLVVIDGDKILKPGVGDVPVSAIAFTKDGITKAQKQQAAAPKSQEPKNQEQ